MISNERTSHSGSSSRGGYGDKAAATEDTLITEKIQIERKSFAFALKENPRGRFLRITEDVGGRRDTIIIPAPGLEEFRRVLELMIEHAGEMPAESEEESGEGSEENPD